MQIELHLSTAGKRSEDADLTLERLQMTLLRGPLVTSKGDRRGRDATLTNRMPSRENSSLSAMTVKPNVLSSPLWIPLGVPRPTKVILEIHRF